MEYDIPDNEAQSRYFFECLNKTEEDMFEQNPDDWDYSNCSFSEVMGDIEGGIWRVKPPGEIGKCFLDFNQVHN